MAATAAPYGMRPVQSVSGAPYTGPFREIKMTTNSANAIYTGQPIILASGEPAAISATPTTSTNGLIGVCIGVRYVTPDLKQPMFAQYLPAGAITAGYTDVWIRVVDDPFALFMIQADGSVARNKISANAALKTFTGSTTTGNSALALDSGTIANTATLAVRIVDFVESTTSTAGDAYTDCIVMWNMGVHSYAQADGTGA